MSRARLRENSSTSTLPIFIGSWDGARKGRSSLMAARLAAGPANAALYGRHGLRRPAAQGIFMSTSWRLVKRLEPRRVAPAVLVWTYYQASVRAWTSSQGTFITY